MQAITTRKTVAVETKKGSVEVRCTTPSIHATMQHPG